MKISGLLSRDIQHRFWSPTIHTLGQARTVLGRVVEEATCELTGGRRHKTRAGVDYCPDVSAGRLFYECKAAGCTNNAFIYAGRLIRDRQFAEEHLLYYAIWHHRAKVGRAADEAELRAMFLANIRGIYIVPFGQIDAICATRPVEILNTAYGRHNEAKDYGHGYRIPIKMLLPWRIGA